MSNVGLETFEHGLLLALAAADIPFAADNPRVHDAFLAATREFPDLTRTPRRDPVFGTVEEAFDLLIGGLDSRIFEFPNSSPQRVIYVVGREQARRELDRTGHAARFLLAAEAFRRCVESR